MLFYKNVLAAPFLLSLVLFLGLAAQSTQAHSAPDENCEKALLNSTENSLTFPKELKLRDEAVEVLLNSDDHAPLLRAIGEIFYLGENHPQFYGAIAQMLSAPPSLSSRNLDTEEHRIAELNERLIASPEDFPLSESARQVLAQLLRKKVNMDGSILQDFYSTAETLEVERQAPDRPATRAAPPYLVNNFHRSSKLVDKYPKAVEFARAFVDAYIERPRQLDLGKYGIHWRFPISQGGVHRFYINHESLQDAVKVLEYKNFEREVTGRSFSVITIGIAYYQIYNLIFYIRHHEPDIERREILDRVEEEIQARLQGFDMPDEILNFLDWIYFGATIQNSDDEVRQILIEEAKIQLLGAKSFATQVKLEKRQVEEQRQRAVEKPAIFEFFTRPMAPRQNSINPKKRKNQPKAPRADIVESLTPAVAPEKTENSLKMVVENEECTLELGKVYDFSFHRNPQNGSQKIIFDKDVLEFLNQMPAVRTKMIRALLLGYTARSSKRTPGIKVMWKRGQKSTSVYALKPGNSDYRIILTNANGLWRAERLLTHDEMMSLYKTN